MKRLVDAWLVLIGKRVVCVCMDDPWYDCQCDVCPCKDCTLERDMFEMRLPLLRGVEIEGFKTATEESLRCGCETCDCKKTLEQIADTWTA